MQTVHFVYLLFFLKDRSQQELSQKTQTEILSAPECLQAHTIHHAVRWSQVMNDNLPTCDRGTDLVENDLGNAQYIQFPIFFKLAANNVSACNVDRAHLKYAQFYFF